MWNFFTPCYSQWRHFQADFKCRYKTDEHLFIYHLIKFKHFSWLGEIGRLSYQCEIKCTGYQSFTLRLWIDNVQFCIDHQSTFIKCLLTNEDWRITHIFKQDPCFKQITKLNLYSAFISWWSRLKYSSGAMLTGAPNVSTMFLSVNLLQTGQWKRNSKQVGPSPQTRFTRHCWVDSLQIRFHTLQSEISKWEVYFNSGW